MRVMLMAILALSVPWATQASPPEPTIQYSIAVQESVTYGAYTIVLARGIPGVIWWKEAPINEWHQDLDLTLKGWDVKNILRDEQPNVFWFYSDVMTTDPRNPNGQPVSMWIRKDLGDGSLWHYGSQTTFHPNGPPEGARPIYGKSTPEND